MDARFNYHSVRARKARFRIFLSAGFRWAFGLLALLNAGLSLLLWESNPIVASMLGAVSLWAFLPLVWYRYDLKPMKPKPIQGDELIIEDILSPEIVGRLSSIEAPADIWHGINGSWHQQFFNLRYGISSEVFKNLAQTKDQTKQVWLDAFELSRAHQEPTLSVASIIVALLKTLPDHQDILAKEHLSLEELETSIDWLHHTESVYGQLGNKGHFGGVARDWTSGFTPMLNKLAHNMSLDIEHGGYIHRDLSVHNQTIDEMLKFLGNTGRANVALVGETGVGKTTTAYSFTQRILSDPQVPGVLRYRKVFMLDAAQIIAKTTDGSKLEAVVLGILKEAVKAKNVIIFLDDAQMFFANAIGAADLGHVLMPFIDHGELPIFMSFTPSEWQNLSARDPHLAGLINTLVINEPDDVSTLQILEDQTLLLEAQHKVSYSYLALKESYRLAERYEHEMVFPGRAISLMETAVNHAENGLVTEASVQASVEATKGVKIQTAGKGEKKKLLNLEEEIHKQMVNQSRAVKAVADALRRARTGVNSPNKPIGTFLFLGPTGVGKTQLSKAIAASYFGKEDQMIRVDMNEFTQSADISRLLDPTKEESLLSAIRRQPFSVVLFDEIEKAHSDVINVFLQLLDEGIMRDANNKRASFKDAIVIATSNAGATIIRQQISAGRDVADIEEAFINKLIESGQFTPEFLNRFDESVVFRPLKPEELMVVVDLLVDEVNATLKRQKVSVHLSSNAKQWLVSKGNDPRLGARPLRRMVQRTVENIVAKRLLNESVKPGADIKLKVSDLEYEVSD